MLGKAVAARLAHGLGRVVEGAWWSKRGEMAPVRRVSTAGLLRLYPSGARDA